jgi:hypothetical protein
MLRKNWRRIIACGYGKAESKANHRGNTKDSTEEHRGEISAIRVLLTFTDFFIFSSIP